MESPQEGGAKDCINVPGHMNKILVATRLSKAVEKGIPWMYIAQTILWSLTLKTMQFCLISQRYVFGKQDIFSYLNSCFNFKHIDRQFNIFFHTFQRRPSRL